jgi:TRAP-type C4-dicarboxylate transport system substrate-binding protein
MPTIGLVVGFAMLAGCAAGNDGGRSDSTNENGEFSWSSVDPVEFTTSSWFPSSHPGNTQLKEWMDAVTEATEGKVTFDYYSDGTLHPGNESLSALTSGLTDVTYVSNGYFPNELPISLWTDEIVQSQIMDFGYPNATIAGTAVANLQYTEDSVARAEMREQGIMPLYVGLQGPVPYTCSDPFSDDASSLAGRKVRVKDRVQQGEVEALGMVGIFTPISEQYEALQRGVLDCAANSAESIIANDFLSLTPWVALPQNAPTSGGGWAISTSTWDALIPEIQQVMLDARLDPLMEQAKAALDSYRDLAVGADSAGGGVIESPKLGKLISEHWKNKPSLVESAPAGVSDPKATIDQIAHLTQTWRDFTVNELHVPAGVTDVAEAAKLGSDVMTEEDWQSWRSAFSEQLGTK